MLDVGGGRVGKRRHLSQATLSMSNDCVCKPRWSGNGEPHPAASLMLSVLGEIDKFLDMK